jgi:peroxiredoxin Q/BCP
MMRLHAGDAALDFAATDIHDHEVRLADFAGRWLLLSFVRYAGCPHCGLRIFYLTSRYAELQQRGLSIVAVTESSLEQTRSQQVLNDAPFAIIADPQRHLFRQFGAESSPWGALLGKLIRRDEMAEARARGLRGPMNGNLFRMPADFLIGPDGKIRLAHYGHDLGDHLPFQAIDEMLTGGVPEVTTHPIR